VTRSPPVTENVSFIIIIIIIIKLTGQTAKQVQPLNKKRK